MLIENCFNRMLPPLIMNLLSWWTIRKNFKCASHPYSKKFFRNKTYSPCERYLSPSINVFLYLNKKGKKAVQRIYDMMDIRIINKYAMWAELRFFYGHLRVIKSNVATLFDLTLIMPYFLCTFIFFYSICWGWMRL